MESQEKKDVRGAVYIDGFNLYHPLCALGDNRLKWLNLWQLSQRILQDRGHTLVSVKYCTAFQRRDVEQLGRHRIYIAAIEAFGVETVHGHYVHGESKPCGNCGEVTTHLNEKQTDINLALCLFSDAMQDRFDWAYLLSADSDQAATAKFLKQFFPDKKLVTVVPPGQPVSEKVANYADGKRKLNRDDIEKCRLPPIIQTASGLVRCPREYE